MAADLILASSRILRMSDSQERCDAIAVKDGRIQALLSADEIESARGPETEVRDVGDHPILPGFIDVHAHVEVACRVAFATVDCRAPACETVGDVLEKLSAAIDSARDGWLVGQANLFFDRKLREKRLPTREELDSVSRDVAIALRAGGHVTVLNSRALERAGIDRRYEPPSGSVTGKPSVGRTSGGEPDGVVREMDNLLPIPADDKADIESAVEWGLRELFTSNGVTTIGEISETVEGIRCMDRLACRGELGARIRIYVWAPGTMALDAAYNARAGLALAANDELLRVQGVKLFADGGYSAASAAVKQPYVHVGHPHRGEIALTRELVSEALEATRQSRHQLAIHANGDRAQEWLCDVIADCGGSPKGALRTRIEHAGNFVPERSTPEAWRRAGIVPVPQPVFLYTFGGYFPDYLGSYGRRGRFPFASLTRDGWRLSGSSDVWVGSEPEATNPLFSVWCCTARESYAGEVIDADESIGVEQALRMHTIDAAHVLGEEEHKGSIEPGKLADLIVLDRDPLTVPLDELRSLRTEEVYLGGRRILEVSRR
jgi:predicted amidohydrolase YtcJ